MPGSFSTLRAESFLTGETSTFYMSGMLLWLVTLGLAGIPAALYERFFTRRQPSVVSLLIWIAAAAGAFATAGLIYVFQRKDLYSLGRSAVFIGLLSYSFVTVTLLADLGLPLHSYQLALQAPESAGIVLSTAIVGTLIFDMVGQRTLERYLVDAEAESGLVGDAPWARDGAST